MDSLALGFRLLNFTWLRPLRSARRAMSCLVCYLLSLAGHLEKHGRELACLVGA